MIFQHISCFNSKLLPYFLHQFDSQKNHQQRIYSKSWSMILLQYKRFPTSVKTNYSKCSTVQRVNHPNQIHKKYHKIVFFKLQELTTYSKDTAVFNIIQDALLLCKRFYQNLREWWVGHNIKKWHMKERQTKGWSFTVKTFSDLLFNEFITQYNIHYNHWHKTGPTEAGRMGETSASPL